ncbi:MAG: hypothetical protein ABI597_12525 [Gammaproteobacteria bacterium]
MNNLELNKIIDHFENMNAEYNQVNDNSSDQEKLSIEIEKLDIIETVKSNLCVLSGKVRFEKNRKISFFKKCFGGAFAIVSTFFTGVAGYLGFYSILSMLINIISPVSLAASILFGLLESIVFLWGDARELRIATGISFFKTSPIMNIYRAQLNLTNDIQNLLISPSCVSKLSLKECCQYQKLLRLVQNDIKNKNNFLLVEHTATIFRKTVKSIAVTAELFSYAGAGFFLGKAILGLLAASLIATPIGISICAGVACFAAVAFCYLRQNKVLSAIDKIAGNPKKLIKDQKKFLSEHGNAATFNNEIGLAIDEKNKKENEVQSLRNQLNLMTKKIFPQIVENTDKICNVEYRKGTMQSNLSENSIFNTSKRIAMA